MIARFVALTVVLLSLGAFSPGIAAAPGLPERFSATYVLKKGFIEFGETRRTLKPSAGGRYVFESETVATGMFSFMLRGHITERSTFLLRNGVIQPVEYFYEKIGGKKPRTARILFDWKEKTIVNSVGDKPWSMELEPGTLDNLIYQLSLMGDISKGQREYSYRIADGGKIKIYKAIVEREEDVSTPAGNFRTIKITHEARNRRTTLWCAPKLHNMPVKIEHIDKDEESYVAVLKTLDGLSTK